MPTTGHDTRTEAQAEPQALQRLALTSSGIRSLASFDEWCHGEIRRLIPFGMLLAALGELRAGVVSITELHALGYPADPSRSIRRAVPLEQRPTILRWLATRQPQVIPGEQARTVLSELEFEEFQALDLRTIAAHGVIDADGRRASYFSFARIDPAVLSDVAHRLELVTPYLHQALHNAIARAPGSGAEPLPRCSAKELELLRELAAGRTTAQIADRLYRSPNTVKHRIAGLMAKLGAANRAQTVARAIELGLVATEAGTAKRL